MYGVHEIVGMNSLRVEIDCKYEIQFCKCIARVDRSWFDGKVSTLQKKKKKKKYVEENIDDTVVIQSCFVYPGFNQSNIVNYQSRYRIVLSI